MYKCHEGVAHYCCVGVRDYDVDEPKYSKPGRSDTAGKNFSCKQPAQGTVKNEINMSLHNQIVIVYT